MTYARPGVTGTGLRLHLNENTAGCSVSVLTALRAMERRDAAAYPHYGDATDACARSLGVPPEWVQLTNGLDEGLYAVAHAAARLGGAGFDAVIVEPAFEIYAAAISAAGGRRITVPPSTDLSLSCEAVAGAATAATRLVYLCDPNNPTGLAIPAGAVARLACAAPEALVLVDEAYADFSGRTFIGPDLDGHRNVVVGRTFAKAHGLAALRVGALVAHPATLARIRHVLPPYSVNRWAAVALTAALRDREYLDWYVGQARASRALISDWCRAQALTCWPSEANFVLVRLGADAAALVRALGEEGIHIRDRSGVPGCEGCVRITAGLVPDTRRALAAMEEWRASRGR